MVTQSILIPGTDYGLICVEYDIEDKTAIFGLLVKNKLTDFLKFDDVKQGTYLNIFSDFVVFVERTTNESLVLAIGQNSDGFFIENTDTNVLGYSSCDVDNLLPGYFLLLDDELTIKKGEKVQLANTNTYARYNSDGEFDIISEKLKSVASGTTLDSGKSPWNDFISQDITVSAIGDKVQIQYNGEEVKVVATGSTLSHDQAPWNKFLKKDIIVHVSGESNIQFSYFKKDIDDYTKNFEPFIPSDTMKKFVVHDNLTNVSWIEGSSEKGGIMFDADGNGEINLVDDWSVYNEFYIRSVSSESISISPAMNIDTLKDEIFELRGQEYLVVERAKQRISLVPILREIIDANISNKKYPTDPEEIIEQQVYSVGNNSRGNNTAFSNQYPSISGDLIKFEPVLLLELRGTCRNENDFNLKIQALCNIIDGFNIECFKELIEDEPQDGTINHLEQYLHEKHPDYDKKMIKNLRNLRWLRSKKLGAHGKDDPKFTKALNYMGFSYPVFDWTRLWVECLRIFNQSLEKLILIHSS